MRPLAKTVIFLGIVTCSIQIVNAASNLAAEIYLNKKYWERMTWQKADTSELWRAMDWLPFDGEQAKTSTITRTRKLTLFGKEFDARLGYDNDKIENKFFVSLSAKASRNDCDELIKELTFVFGKPIASDRTFVPLMYSEQNYMKMVILDYQWDIGETRIDAGCFGSVTQDTESRKDTLDFTSSIKYAHRSATDKLIPKFALRCTRKMEFEFKPGFVREMPDLVIWVDIRSAHITNASNQPISDLHTFQADDREIKFKISGTSANQMKLVTEYTLDRVTGSLNAALTDLSYPNVIAARIRGRCDKTDTIEKKF